MKALAYLYLGFLFVILVLPFAGVLFISAKGSYARTAALFVLSIIGAALIVGGVLALEWLSDEIGSLVAGIVWWAIFIIAGYSCWVGIRAASSGSDTPATILSTVATSFRLVALAAIRGGALAGAIVFALCLFVGSSAAGLSLMMSHPPERLRGLAGVSAGLTILFLVLMGAAITAGNPIVVVLLVVGIPLLTVWVYRRVRRDAPVSPEHSAG